MKVYTRTIEQVFEGARRYVIPLFQRQYVWTEEKQWQPLWEDIQSQAELALRGEADDRPPHFMGAIVLSSLPFHNDEIKAQQVIDGQQRLTTFQLFLAAFRDVCRQVDPVRAASIAKLCLNDGPMEGPHEKYKVWPTGADVPQFTEAVALSSIDELRKRYPPALVKKRKNVEPELVGPLPRMLSAYHFFGMALTAFIGTGDDASRRVKAIFTALRQGLQLVSIELDGNEDPQIIFETLNARGEPLLPSDLLRNFVFLRADRARENSHRLYDTYWKPFDEEPESATDSAGEKFWKKEVVQGRLTRARMDLFMQHFLSMKTGAEANISRLFHEYRLWAGPKVPGRYPTVEAELQDITAYAKRFQSLVRPDIDTRLGLAASRFMTLDMTTAYPLLLSLMGNEALSPPDRDGIVADLESYVIRRAICGRTAKGYNHILLRLMQRFVKEPTQDRATFARLLLDHEGETGDFPTDEQFRSAWMTIPAYKTLKAGRVEMILRALNRQLTNAKNGGLLPTQKLTVEHVMPQKWEQHWPLAGVFEGDEYEEAVDRRDSLIHTFGNLTLMTQALNGSVGNETYADKKKEFVVHAGLWINGYFQDVDGWDEAAIEVRSKALFALALKVWPRPAVQAAAMSA